MTVSVPAPGSSRPSVQAVGQIDDFRFACGVFDDGGALRQSRRHHQVLGAGHGHGIEYESRAAQTLAPARM